MPLRARRLLRQFVNVDIAEFAFWESESTSRHDSDNFQAVAVADLTLGELRWRDRFAVLLHDDTARQKVLRAKEGIQ